MYDPKDKNREHLNMRVPESMKRGLEEEADKQKRSLSNLVQFILAQWLEQKRG